jgi:hypothetical protein
MGIKIRKRIYQFKKTLSKSRKSSQGQEKDVFIKTKRISQRHNPKDSGNYQKQIPLPYGKQKNKTNGRDRI